MTWWIFCKHNWTKKKVLNYCISSCVCLIHNSGLEIIKHIFMFKLTFVKRNKRKKKICTLLCFCHPWYAIYSSCDVDGVLQSFQWVISIPHFLTEKGNEKPPKILFWLSSTRLHLDQNMYHLLVISWRKIVVSFTHWFCFCAHCIRFDYSVETTRSSAYCCHRNLLNTLLC